MCPLIAERVGQAEEQEAATEHVLAREGCRSWRNWLDEPGFGAAVAMVTAGIKHHVKEEETALFPELKAKLDRTELAELGDGVAAMKKQRRKLDPRRLPLGRLEVSK